MTSAHPAPILRTSNGGDIVQGRPYAAVVHDYLESMKESSARTLDQALRKVAEMLQPGATPGELDLGGLTADRVAGLQAELTATYAPATVRKVMAALKGVLQAAEDKGAIPPGRTVELTHKAFIGRPPRIVPVAEQRSLTFEDVRRIFETLAADPSPAARRDTALVALAYALQLRPRELVALDLKDIDQDGPRVRVDGAWIPLSTGAATAVLDWIETRGDHAGPLFIDLRGREPRSWRWRPRLKAGAVTSTIRDRGHAAGLPGLSIADLRRETTERRWVKHQDITSTDQTSLLENIPATTAAQLEQQATPSPNTSSKGNSWRVIDNPDTRAERDNGEEVER